MNKTEICKVIMAAAVAFGMSGCSDYLDKNPLGKLNEAVITSADAIDQMLVSAYAPLNGYVNGMWGISTGPDNCFVADMGAGNIHKGSTTGDLSDWLDIERFQAKPTNGRLDKWTLLYGAIERCNNVLQTLEKNEISDLTEEGKAEMVAEARFLRGYYHSEAKILWNMVPYLDENVEDIKKRVANDHSIWPEIEADLSYAVSVLPETQSDFGRPTKYAAMGLLAKVYLFQQEYGKAKPLLDEIIASGKYALHADFYDNFNPEANNGIESVWQNQVAVNVEDAGYNRSQRAGDLSYPNTSDIPELSGAGFCQPTFDLVNAYKTDENGLPLLDTYYETDFKNDMGIESEEAFEPDMTTPVDPRLDWTVGRRGVPYHDWGVHPGKKWIRDQPSAGPYNQKKYVILKSQLDKYAYNNTAKFNAMNFNIIRYAQILLWAAECEIEVGDAEKARSYVNMVRARARDGKVVRLGEDAPFGDGQPAANYKVDIYKDSWAGQSKDYMWKRVQFEERLEFATEGHWLFDLHRWGIDVDFINKYIAREKKHIEYLNGVVYDTNHRYLPIPQSQIDNSYKDGQPTLTQNQGY